MDTKRQLSALLRIIRRVCMRSNDSGRARLQVPKHEPPTLSTNLGHDKYLEVYLIIADTFVCVL